LRRTFTADTGAPCASAADCVREVDPGVVARVIGIGRRRSTSGYCARAGFGSAVAASIVDAVGRDFTGYLVDESSCLSIGLPAVLNQSTKGYRPVEARYLGFLLADRYCRRRQSAAPLSPPNFSAAGPGLRPLIPPSTARGRGLHAWLLEEVSITRLAEPLKFHLPD